MGREIPERVEKFIKIRDIPYYISVGQEPDYCCSTKAEMLAESLGLGSRYIKCEFRWEELNLPDEILKFPHEDPEYHQYLEVHIPETGRWVVVDPTWDKGLNDIFEITEWDGMNGTAIAVPAKKIYSPEESEALIRKDNDPNEIEVYMIKNRRFFIALNSYFEHLRDI